MRIYQALSVSGALLVAVAASTAWGAGAIDTNRPGFSFSPRTVTAGTWQLETGFEYTRGNGANRTYEIPIAEVRLGVAERTELFASGITWSRREGERNTQSGVNDIELGIKYALTGADRGFSTALLGLVNAPVGDEAFTSDRWDPTVAFAWAGNNLPIAGTLKVGDRKSGYQVDNGIRWVLASPEGVTSFLEWEANLPERGDDNHWLNLGAQWLTHQHIQLDVNAGIGLTRKTDDYRLGIGFSYRF